MLLPAAVRGLLVRPTSEAHMLRGLNLCQAALMCTLGSVMQAQRRRGRGRDRMRGGQHQARLLGAGSSRRHHTMRCEEEEQLQHPWPCLQPLSPRRASCTNQWPMTSVRLTLTRCWVGTATRLGPHMPCLHCLFLLLTTMVLFQ